MKHKQQVSQPESSRTGTEVNDRFTVFAECLHNLCAALDLDSALQKTVEGIYRLARADSVTIFISSDNCKELITSAHYGTRDNPSLPACIPIDDMLLALLAPAQQMPMWLPVDALINDNLRQTSPELNLPQTAIAPLWWQQNLTAILLVEWTKDDPLYMQLDPFLTQYIIEASGAIHRVAESIGLNNRLAEVSSLINMDKVLEDSTSYRASMRILLGHVRNLIDVDVVSLMLYDPATDTLVLQEGSIPFVESVDNEIKLQALYRLPVNGGGIVPTVFKTGKPYLSNDPINDPIALKNWVRYFGTRNIMCAPVEVNGCRIGVLDTSNKRVGDFTDKDFQMICLLASHLGLLVQNVRMLIGERETAAHLKELNMEINQQYKRIRRLLEIHDAFNQEVLMGHGVNKIVAALQKILVNPVVVRDRFGNVVAQTPSSGGSDQNSDHSENIGLAGLPPAAGSDSVLQTILAQSNNDFKPMRLPANPAIGLETPWITMPILAGREILGHLSVVEVNHTLDDTDILTLERACISIALQMMKEQATIQTQYRLRNDFIAVLISENGGRTENLRSQGTYLDIDLNPQRAVMVIRLGFKAKSENKTLDGSVTSALNIKLPDLLDRLFRNKLRGCIQATKGEDTIVLAKIEAKEEIDCEEEVLQLAEAIRSEIMHWLPEADILIGIGNCVHDIPDYSRSYRQARIALRVAEISGRDQGAIHYAQLGIYGSLFASKDRDGLEAQLNETLGDLLDYDRTHHSELIKTLERYLKNSCNLSQTAVDLYIHPNTLRHRIGRIEEVLGCDLSSLEDKLALLFAIKILHILGET